MNSKILAALALGGAALAVSPAFASTTTATGTVPGFCAATFVAPAGTISMTNKGQQRIADLSVRCNNDNTPNFSVTATNGSFDNPLQDVDYDGTVDLQGTGANNSQSTSNPAAGGVVGVVSALTPGQQLSQGITGILSVRLLADAWAAGTYTETFTASIG